MKYSGLYFSLILFFLSSCIKKIDYKLKDIPSQLVISGIFTPDSLVKVYVSSAKTLFDTNAIMIDNAEVLFYQNNGLLDTFIYMGKGLYMLPNNFYPIEGRTYKIVVNAKGYEQITAQSYIPVLNSNYSLKVTYPYKYDQNNESITLFEITIKDFSIDPNYYEFVLFNKEFTGYSYAHVNMKSDDNILKEEGDIPYSPPSILISDKHFNEHTTTIRFELFEFGFGEISSPANNIYYSLRSVSESYYKYKKYLLRHKYNQNSNDYLNDPLHLLFSGEPTNMYSNVTNGYGVVVGYSGTLKQIIL